MCYNAILDMNLMKKIALFLLITTLLAGCQFEDFALKEKCGQFVKGAIELVETSNKNASVSDGSINYYFKGVYYSRKFNTCVSVSESKVYDVKNGSSVTLTFFRDELTGNLIQNNEIYELMKGKPEDLEKYFVFIK